jgi:hypothetical protein
MRSCLVVLIFWTKEILPSQSGLVGFGLSEKYGLSVKAFPQNRLNAMYSLRQARRMNTAYGGPMRRTDCTSLGSMSAGQDSAQLAHDASQFTLNNVGVLAGVTVRRISRT